MRHSNSRQLKIMIKTIWVSTRLRGQIFSVRTSSFILNLRSGRLTRRTAWEKIPSSLRSNFSKTAKEALSKFPADWPEVEYLVTSAFFGYQQNFIQDAPTDGYQYSTMAVALITPLSRGTIDISSPNMTDPPLINPNWLTDPTDQEVIVAGYKRARQIMHTKAMGNITIGPEYFPGPALHVQSDAEILDFIRKSFNTVFHASSTCSMGTYSDPNAVVDANAKVIGVQGLRVVDASAMPFLPPGHPVATICKFCFNPSPASCVE